MENAESMKRDRVKGFNTFTGVPEGQENENGIEVIFNNLWSRIFPRTIQRNQTKIHEALQDTEQEEYKENHTFTYHSLTAKKILIIKLDEKNEIQLYAAY